MNESPCKCIVVAPAYRVNVFGFLASPGLLENHTDSAVNLGFWDQRLALQWTYENISYFGGNASNITIAGYSAGSHSVFHQLAYDLGVPENKAIVKRAIMLSNGSGMQPKSMVEVQDQFNELLAVLGIPTTLPYREIITRLRTLDAMKLLQAVRKMKIHQFRAVTDGQFVRHGLFDEINNGIFASRMKQRGVKLMIGECSDEHHVYGAWRPPQPGLDNLLHRLEADYPREACKVLMAHYFPDRKLPSKYKSWQDAFGHIYADVQIYHLGRGQIISLAKRGANDLIHRYRIEWRAKCVDKKYPKSWGVTHTSDLPIWFWGNGEDLTEEEKVIATRAFQEPLSKFLNGEEMNWGTQSFTQIRTLKSDGTVVVEEDTRLEEGLRLWEVLKKAGATRQPKLSKL